LLAVSHSGIKAYENLNLVFSSMWKVFGGKGKREGKEKAEWTGTFLYVFMHFKM